MVAARRARRTSALSPVCTEGVAGLTKDDQPNACIASRVASEQHDPWPNPVGTRRIGQHGPTEAVVVLGIEVCHWVMDGIRPARTRRLAADANRELRVIALGS